MPATPSGRPPGPDDVLYDWHEGDSSAGKYLYGYPKHPFIPPAKVAMTEGHPSQQDFEVTTSWAHNIDGPSDRRPDGGSDDDDLLDMHMLALASDFDRDPDHSLRQGGFSDLESAQQRANDWSRRRLDHFEGRA